MLHKMKCAMMSALLLAFAVGGADAQDRGSRRVRPEGNAPRIGDDAPTFVLKSLDGKSETNLADFAGKRPVVLYFGSYT